MKYPLFAIELIVIALTGTVRPAEAGKLSPPSQGEFHWRGQIAAGKILEIKDINGSVHAEPASNNDAEVTAIKRGRRSDPKEVEIKVVEHNNGITICAVYPSNNPAEPNECRPGEAGRMNTRNNDVSVEFTVRVPLGVNFIGRTVNGQVEATSLKGDVEAHTVNGNVHISTSGYGRGRTVNGSINASMGSSNWPNSLDLETVNGSITVTLPAETNTRFRAETVNGNISTDFPLTIQGKLSPKHIEGTIGTGGRELSVKTVNGSIELRRGH
jgi:hypothetical protein